MLFVHDLAENLLSFYQMTHTGTAKRVTFTQNDLEISVVSTLQVVVVGFADHDSIMTNSLIYFHTRKGMCFCHMPMRQESCGMRDMVISTIGTFSLDDHISHSKNFLSHYHVTGTHSLVSMEGSERILTFSNHG